MFGTNVLMRLSVKVTVKYSFSLLSVLVYSITLVLLFVAAAAEHGLSSGFFPTK